MSEVTVKEFAETIGVPVDRLVGQLKDAGVSAESADSIIGDDDKVKLRDYLRNKHGTEKEATAEDSGPKKITLKRRTTSELKVGGSTNARGKTVKVETRKKRTYVKRTAVAADEASGGPSERLRELGRELGNRVEGLHLLRVHQVLHLGERLGPDHRPDGHGLVWIEHLPRLERRQEGVDLLLRREVDGLVGVGQHETVHADHDRERQLLGELERLHVQVGRLLVRLRVELDPARVAL